MKMNQEKWKREKKEKKKRRNKQTMISMTKMAMLQSDEPRERRLVKDSCPGVSITSNPGTLTSKEAPLWI
jgi:hypothetical protein